MPAKLLSLNRLLVLNVLIANLHSLFIVAKHISPDTMVCVGSQNRLTILSAHEPTDSYPFPRIQHVPVHVAHVKLTPRASDLKEPDNVIITDSVKMSYVKFSAVFSP